MPVSAKTGEGIQDLLENILVAAEVLELKANPDRLAIGTVIEAEMDRTRGPTATVLVQTGTLRVGDVCVVSETWGRVKAMFDEDGKRIKSAGPGEPAVVLGLQEVPRAGDVLTVVPDEKTARQMVLQRLREREAANLHVQPRVSLDTLFGEISAGKMKDLNIILKTDVQGSIEPLRQSLERLSTEQVRVNVIHAASGSVNESDVKLAIASKGIIIAFNTTRRAGRPAPDRAGGRRPAPVQRHLPGHRGRREGAPGHAGAGLPRCRHRPRRGRARSSSMRRKPAVAGCYVTDGTISRSDSVRVLRGGEVVIDTKIASLRRFQEDVREVQTGFECGIMLEDFAGFQVGDILEFYRVERAN